MSKTAVYNTTVEWKGEHWGHIVMGNGPEMDFSAPPDAQEKVSHESHELGWVAPDMLPEPLAAATGRVAIRRPHTPQPVN